MASPAILLDWHCCRTGALLITRSDLNWKYTVSQSQQFPMMGFTSSDIRYLQCKHLLVFTLGFSQQREILGWNSSNLFGMSTWTRRETNHATDTPASSLFLGGQLTWCTLIPLYRGQQVGCRLEAFLETPQASVILFSNIREKRKMLTYKDAVLC